MPERTPERVEERVEYGIRCNVRTEWLDGPHTLPFRWWRWLTAHIVAWNCNDRDFTERYGCGRHVVVRRVTTITRVERVTEEG